VSPTAGGGAPVGEGTTPRRAAHGALAGGVLAALVLATFLAIFFAQELKRRPALLAEPQGYGVITLQPAGTITLRHVHHYAHLNVEATVGDQRLTLLVVSERTGRTVWSVSFRVHEYRTVAISWRGTTSARAPAPPGYYRLRVRFQHPATTVDPGLTLHLLGPSS